MLDHQETFFLITTPLVSLRINKVHTGDCPSIISINDKKYFPLFILTVSLEWPKE